MSKLSWGKPKVERGTSTGGAQASVWNQFPEIKEGTAKLTPTKGAKKEAKQEGGKIVDVKYGANAYAFEFEIFVKKGDSRPMEDIDGVIAGEYSVRLTPEDPACEGFVMDRCIASCEESWASEEGKLLKYTFDGLEPASGNICKPYTENALAVDKSELWFASPIDSTGKTVTATSTGNVSASSSESWCTVATAGKVTTIKTASANSGTAARTAYVTITADNKTAQVKVTQIPA